PQLVAGARVVGHQVAVDLAAEDQSASGAHRAVALIATFALLPDDLVVAAVHGGEGVADRRTERRRTATSAVALALHIPVRAPRRRARLLATHDVHVAGLRTVGGRTPLRAAVAGGTRQRGDVPECSEDAAAPREAWHRVWTLVDERVANGIRLRRRGELTRL